MTGVFIGFLIAGGLFAAFVFYASFLYICRPNEILIFSGGRYATPDGREVGSRVIFGGRAWRTPIIEKAQRMDMTVMSVPVEVKNAYSKGGIPLNIHSIANVKISSDDRYVHNAIERFLGRDRTEIMRVAKETLEGNVRGVLAKLTPEEVNEDRLKFAREVADDVDDDLSKLGLQLDVLKIQSVEDDTGYLEGIGRRQIAEIVKQAEIAESDAKREADVVEAQCGQQAEVASQTARRAVVSAQNELRQLVADFEGQVRSEEERTESAAQAARAEAEKELQAVRSQVEQLRLMADVVLPAEAGRQARELVAAGQAAPIAENARASAKVLSDIATVFGESPGAADAFLIQQIEMVLKQAASAARRVQVDHLALIDGGDGETLSSVVASYPAVIGSVLEEVRTTLGIDVVGALHGRTNGNGNGNGHGQANGKES